MGVLRSTVGEGSFLQTLAGRTTGPGNPQEFKSSIIATVPRTDESSDSIDDAGEEVLNVENSAGILARQELSRRPHQLWRRQQHKISRLQSVARGHLSVRSEELQISNLKISSGQSSQGAVKVQDGPHPPPSPSIATEDPFRGPNENQKAGSNNKGGGQNKYQGSGSSGGQNTNQGQNPNQGKGFNQAGQPRPSEKVDNQGPGQNGNQEDGPDQFGGPKPNQNVGGQNSQNQENNGNGSQVPDPGKNGNSGKGDPSPKPKQNQNGNQNSDRTSESRPPKQTSTSDQTSSTPPTSSLAVQTTEPQAQPTDPLPSSQPLPPSAQTAQQPSQAPTIMPSLQTSTVSMVPSTAASLPSSSTSSVFSETQVPTPVLPTPTTIGQPVAALEPTTSQVPQSVVTQGSLQPTIPSNGLTSREIIGISVGGVSALVLISALLVLFLKLKRLGVLPFRKQALYRTRDMAEDIDGGKRLSGAEMGVSLVSQAAPVAGTLDAQETFPLATERNHITSPHEVQQPHYVAYRPSRDISRINDKGQGLPSRSDDEDQSRMSIASNPFSLQDELRTIVTPKARKSILPAAKTNLVQQPEPAESKDCPFQRLQGKLRIHNSSDPRPPRQFSRKPTAIDRGSVSTMSTSATDRSPHTSARFSFGLLLQPSLDLFKFSDIRSSLGGRGSGWSLWFKQDDASNEKPSNHPDMVTK